MYCPAAMTQADPAWLILRNLLVLGALLMVLLDGTSWRLQELETPNECTWEVVLNSFEKVGEENANDRFSDQEPLDVVNKQFRQLVDLPIDADEIYLGFPYYLKINYSCNGQSSAALMRSGHLMGLKPLVLIIFQTPVNFYHWKIENLEIQMEAVPLRNNAL